MDRRGFLKGMFGGVTAAGVIIAASQSEIAAFASPLVEGSPVALDMPAADPSRLQAGEHLYNAAGELVAIVTGLNLRQETIEATMWGDSNRVYVPGLKHIEITAEGVGAMAWHTVEKFPRLKGANYGR